MSLWHISGYTVILSKILELFFVTFIAVLILCLSGFAFSDIVNHCTVDLYCECLFLIFIDDVNVFKRHFLTGLSNILSTVFVNMSFQRYKCLDQTFSRLLINLWLALKVMFLD